MVAKTEIVEESCSFILVVAKWEAANPGPCEHVHIHGGLVCLCYWVGFLFHSFCTLSASVLHTCIFTCMYHSCISTRQLHVIQVPISASAFRALYMPFMSSLFVPLKRATSSFIDLVNARNVFNLSIQFAEHLRIARIVCEQCH